MEIRARNHLEPVTDHVRHIESVLSAADMEDLQAACRRYATNIEGLAVAIAADKEGRKVEAIRKQMDFEANTAAFFNVGTDELLVE